MKWIILVSLLCLNAQAVEYEVDLTAVQLEHAWRGPSNYSNFNSTLVGIGGTAWFDSGWGVRAGYLKGEYLNTVGQFEHITIRMKYIASLELLYRYEVVDGLHLLAGIGTHLIPVPMYWEGIDPDSHAATDADNDEGYMLGAQWSINKDWSVGWRFTHYSRIKGDVYDEWIKGHSLNISYKF